MFKNVFVITLIMSLFACGGQNQETQLNVVDNVNPEAESRGERNQAIILLNNLGFVTQVDLETKEIKKWGTPLRIMDIVEYLEEDVELSFNNRKAIYAKIRRNSNEEGYANKNYVVPNALPGVIVAERASFYRQPDLASPENRFVLKGDLIAVLNDSATNNFVKVAYANPNDSSIVTNRFLKAETISTTIEDVNSMVMYFLALRAKDKVMREELLKNAMQFNSSIFSPQIQAEMQIVQANFNQEILVKDNQFNVIFDETIVYNLPFETASVVQILNKDAKLVANRKLVKQNEVWYEIAEPAGFINASGLELISQPSQ